MTTTTTTTASTVKLVAAITRAHLRQLGVDYALAVAVVALVTPVVVLVPLVRRVPATFPRQE